MSSEELYNLDKLYLNSTSPNEILKHFSCKEEFEDWLDMGSLKDLYYTLIAFEKSELYEHCALINKKIEAIKNK